MSDSGARAAAGSPMRLSPAQSRGLAIAALLAASPQQPLRRSIRRPADATAAADSAPRLRPGDGGLSHRLSRVETELRRVAATQREILQQVNRLVHALVRPERGGARPVRGIGPGTPAPATPHTKGLHTSLVLAGAAVKAGLQLPGVRRLLRGYAPVLLALSGGLPQLLNTGLLRLVAGSYRRALALRVQHIADLVPREAVWAWIVAACGTIASWAQRVAAASGGWG